MSRLPTAAQLDEFERVLIGWWRENCNLLIRSLYGMGERAEIQSATNKVLAEIFDNYRRGKPAPENLGAFVYRAVRNRLIDIRPPAPPVDPIDPPDDPWDRRVEDEIAWRDLVRAIFDRLPSEWHLATTMIMRGDPLEDIARECGWTDASRYRLRAYVREWICRILTELTNGGNDEARGLAQELCPARGTRKAVARGIARSRRQSC